MSSKTVLVIEDDEGISQSIGDRLRYEGYDVVIANNGARGYNIATETLPDLIVLDLYLPGLDGFDICAKLKNNRETSGICILILSIRSETSDVERALKLGANDYIKKPADMADVASKVKYLLTVGCE